MTLFTRYVQAVKDTLVWPDKFKIGLVAWAIAEQGKGRDDPDPNCMDELARYADNYHSLHVRKEMTPYYPCVYHLKETREIDNNYIDFNGPAEELEGLLRFIHRPGYGDIDAHMGSFEELLRHLCPSPGYSFCPTLGYIDRVLSFRTEAEAELRKLGWTPEEEPVVEPVVSEFNIRKHRLFFGDNPVPFFDTPNKGFGATKNTPKSIILHYTASLGMSGIINWFQNKISRVSIHFVISREGTVVQLVPLDIPAWHAGDIFYNKNSIGIEYESLGSSRIRVGNNVVFYGWGGPKLVPVSECVYAHHPKEPNIWRYWPRLTDAQYNTSNQLFPVLRSQYGALGMLEHWEIMPGKLDVGCALEKKRLGM
jgi:N-acetylmuramoyl-L-alanine amidase